MQNMQITARKIADQLPDAAARLYVFSKECFGKTNQTNDAFYEIMCTVQKKRMCIIAVLTQIRGKMPCKLRTRLI